MTTSTMLGSYRLVAELGHGGMADVYLAVQQGPAGSGFSKLAVVKKLRENLAEDPDFVAMLMDEARITARLSHPNVVQLFEVGQEKDTYFLAIEYLEGQPLHRIGRRAKRERIDVPHELYYTIVSDVLAGLHHAHDLADYDGSPLEIVHRDVTPHNIFVTYDGAVKVVDFGIAKAMGRATETKQGIVKGKVPYMSPEQVIGGKVDRRTDIFAVGVILWNAATGTKLWADMDEVAIVRALCSGRYDASPRAICPDVPEAIDAICRKALAYRPEDRYATAAEMRADIEAFLGKADANVRKQLESAMKELFAPERVKLRAVLEAARLTSAVSPDAFAAATMGPRDGKADSDAPPEDEQHTRVMPNAPQRPVPPPVPLEQLMPPPSIAAMSLPNGPNGPSPWRFDYTTSTMRHAAARTRSKITLAVAGVVTVTALGVLVVFGARSAEQTNEGAADPSPRARMSASVVPDVTPLSKTVRTKAERQPEVPEKAEKPEKPGATGRRSALARRSGSANQQSEPTNEPPPTPTSPARDGKGKKDPSGKLDDTDPWRVKMAD